jgi:hypothetical protein
MNMQVQPAIVDTALPISPPLDIERLQALVMKLNDAFALIGYIVKAARKEGAGANHEVILDHVELLADTYADMAFEVLEMVYKLELQDEDTDE